MSAGSPAGSTPSDDSTGISAMPARRLALCGLRRSKILPSRVTSARSTTASLRSLETKRGKAWASPAFLASHHSDSGHFAQSGTPLRQTVAPSSIMAWLKSPGCLGSTSSSAREVNSFAADEVSRSLARTPSRRARTRTTLPSTTATGSAKAILAMAAAVYGPTPLNSRHSAAVRGGDFNAATCFARFRRLRARE